MKTIVRIGFMGLSLLLICQPSVIRPNETKKKPGDYYKTLIQRQNLGIILGYPFLGQKRKPVKSVTKVIGSRMLTRFKYYPDGWPSNVKTETKRKMTEDAKVNIVYLYDKEGKLKKCISRYYSSDELYAEKSRIFSYNKKKRITGYISEHFYFMPAGKDITNSRKVLSHKLTGKYIYDLNGKVLREDILREDTEFNEGSYIPGMTSRSTNRFFYGSKGKLIKQIMKSHVSKNVLDYLYNRNLELTGSKSQIVLKFDKKEDVFSGTVKYYYK